MVAGVYLMAATAITASVLQAQSMNMIVLGAIIIGGIFAWRQKRGDFYKAVAEEKTDENKELNRELEQRRQLTDLTPIVETLHDVVEALDRHSAMTERVFDKVADMNGSLRAHGEAMKALADHLILDEAARALLAEAATKDRPAQPRHQRRRAE